LQQITKREKEWLIENNILKLTGGKYLDLSITSRKKSRKKYYVPDYMAFRVAREMYKK